ncbi:acetyl-CoA C-acyltransferase (plasmid) [Paraburkholderia sprentiae WSM5005]|uniref:Acetyl-CoA C-acyltransferase n=1 Tax=Paraburkholderia sprentiae WSM5005 TaxID=754502 RepID=A0A8F4QJY4_9BURK|nr:acetyl-CoA C-acyltransferase [Paraburkholderia sprentiae WSM5005]
MRRAVIVSTARTPIGKAFRGSLNCTKSPTLMGHAIRHAVRRASAEGSEVDDVVVGTVLGAGTAGGNLARFAALAAGLPETVSGQTLDRQCSSGLMAIATAAKQIMVDGMQIVVAGGQENISALQERYMAWTADEQDPAVVASAAHAYMPMLQTAEFVSEKYGLSRIAQDEYALESQLRTAAAQRAGVFDDEIVPIRTTMKVVDNATQTISFKEVELARDEGNRPDTTLDNLQKLQPVLEGGRVTAGNASQLSDGASACVLMDSQLAERRGLDILGTYLGMAVAGCAPEEMGIGPVYAIPKLLAHHGLRVQDVGLWELNEAFACQALYCRDRLGIDPLSYNVHGGGISVGHPYGMTGARLVGHALLEGRRRKVRYVVVSMTSGGGRAIEDAVVLAECLAAPGKAAQALEAYSSRRIPRVKRVWEASFQISRWEREDPVGNAQRTAALLLDCYKFLGEPI